MTPLTAKYSSFDLEIMTLQNSLVKCFFLKEIKKLSKEKADLESKYNAELKRASEQSSSKELSLRRELEEVTAKLKRDHCKELEETKTKLGNEHSANVRTLQRDFQEKLSLKEKDLLEKSEQELERLRVEKNEVIAQFESHCGDLKTKLKSSEEEVDRLEKLVHDSEKGLGSASSHIDSLKEALNQTKGELQKTKSDLKEAENNYAKSMVRIFYVHVVVTV